MEEATIEILPALARTIDFAGLEEWETRAAAFREGEKPAAEPTLPPTSLT